MGLKDFCGRKNLKIKEKLQRRRNWSLKWRACGMKVMAAARRASCLTCTTHLWNQDGASLSPAVKDDAGLKPDLGSSQWCFHHVMTILRLGASKNYKVQVISLILIEVSVNYHPVLWISPGTWPIFLQPNKWENKFLLKWGISGQCQSFTIILELFLILMLLTQTCASNLKWFIHLRHSKIFIQKNTSG